MPSTNTPDQNSIPPSHQDFRWIHAPNKDRALAGFIELTHDIAAGVSSCLQIIYASELAREINIDADPGQESAPSIGKTDAANLMRLSMAATTLLCRASEDCIAGFNKSTEK